MRLTAARTRAGFLAGIAALMLTVTGVPPATSLSGVAGSCEFVTLDLYRDQWGTTHLDGGSTLCVVSGFDMPGIVGDAANSGSLAIWSQDIDVLCSGSAVRGVSALASITVRSNSGFRKSFSDVRLDLESPSGAQGSNPTATLLVKGIEFAGTGAFVRSGSGACGTPSATWSLGSLVFEDPQL